MKILVFILIIFGSLAYFLVDLDPLTGDTLLLERAKCEQTLQLANSDDAYCQVPGTTAVILRMGLKN